MKIEKFEDIQAWKYSRKLTQMVYELTRKKEFSHDYGLVNQIRTAAGSSMHNIAEGFDAESNAEFIRFLRYAKRSCTEVQSELYVALDEKYISEYEFQESYDHAGTTRATIRGFINYLSKYENDKKAIR